MFHRNFIASTWSVNSMAYRVSGRAVKSVETRNECQINLCRKGTSQPTVASACFIFTIDNQTTMDSVSIRAILDIKRQRTFYENFLAYTAHDHGPTADWPGPGVPCAALRSLVGSRVG